MSVGVGVDGDGDGDGTICLGRLDRRRYVPRDSLPLPRQCTFLRF